MTDRRPPPPHRRPLSPSRLAISNIRSTTQLLKQTTLSFSSNFLTFLFLSLLLFSFRSFIEDGSLLLTSFIDRDPSLPSLLSRLDLSTAPDAVHRHHYRHRHRRRAFLHLTRTGTLDDDFFSGDEDYADNPLLGHHQHYRRRGSQSNGSLVMISNFNPKFGFSEFVVDSGVKIHEIVRPGIQLKAQDHAYHEQDEDPGDNDGEGGGGSDGSGRDDKDLDLQFLIKGDVATLFFLVSFLSAAYGWVILGFTAIYSWMLGIVFVAVVNDLIGRWRHFSFVGVAWDGSRLGLSNLTGFVLMRWAVRDAVTQLVGLWYFGEIEDRYSFFKLFVRLKLMPFSIMSPWIRGFEKEISGFLFAWFLVDACVGLMLAVDAWVTIENAGRTGREIVKEGCYLISTLLSQSVQIKCLEAILCGSTARWALTKVFGKVLAAVLQSTFEVYFMVAWLIFYLVARCRDARVEGRRFGRRELEEMIDGLR